MKEIKITKITYGCSRREREREREKREKQLDVDEDEEVDGCGCGGEGVEVGAEDGVVGGGGEVDVDTVVAHWVLDVEGGRLLAQVS